MRVSTLPGDPGYRGDCYGWRVTLNGRERRDVVTADEEIGILTFVQRDPYGRIVVKDGRAVYRRDVGIVRLERVSDRRD